MRKACVAEKVRFWYRANWRTHSFPTLYTRAAGIQSAEYDEARPSHSVGTAGGAAADVGAAPPTAATFDVVPSCGAVALVMSRFDDCQFRGTNRARRRAQTGWSWDGGWWLAGCPWLSRGLVSLRNEGCVHGAVATLLGSSRWSQRMQAARECDVRVGAARGRSRAVSQLRTGRRENGSRRRCDHKRVWDGTGLAGSSITERTARTSMDSNLRYMRILNQLSSRCDGHDVLLGKRGSITTQDAGPSVFVCDTVTSENPNR